MKRSKFRKFDAEDDILLERGWEPIGLGGWRHSTQTKPFFTKQEALETDLSGFHNIEVEHQRMLNSLQAIANLPADTDTSTAIDMAHDVLKILRYTND